MNKIKIQERYHRQIILKGFGEAAQISLSQAKVLVIGAGGLGCPVLQYLSAAGVGCMGIAEDDVVNVSNLHRQTLFTTADIGLSKCSVAAAKLRLMNDEIIINEHQFKVQQSNCLTLLEGYDVVVDCTDNFSARYMINDAAVLLGKPLVHAAVSGYEGQVAVFNLSDKQNNRSGNYRDLFPDQPLIGEVKNCAEEGVLGVLPGIIGSMQAAEVIKIITGLGKPLINQLLTYHLLDHASFIFNYQPGIYSETITRQIFEERNYLQDFLVAEDNVINIQQFKRMYKENDTICIDVSEKKELLLMMGFDCINIPLPAIIDHLDNIKQDNIIFICQSGTRSLQAVSMAKQYLGTAKNIYSLKGGIQSMEMV